MRPVAAIALLCLFPATTAQAQASSDVTIYRCIDAKGHVTLGDTPCPSGSTEQMRTMQRPQDAPPAPAAVVDVVAPATQQPPAAQQVVVLRPPQPMYECTAPDGSRYTSDTAEGNPRWVPLWTIGYRSRGRGGPRPSNDAADRLNEYQTNRPLGGWVGAPTPSPPPPTSGGGHRPGPRPPGLGYGGAPGTWVRDTCHALPPAEVCARLRDRREVIRRRFFNAQETERNELRREERNINARLQADCG